MLRHVLIVRASAIGDFVLNLPALRALALRHPDARFTLVGYPETLKLAERFIPVQAIESIDSVPWRRLFFEPAPELGHRPFDAAFVWMKDRAFADNLSRSGVPNIRHSAPFPDRGHAGAHLVKSTGLESPELPDLWLPGSARVILHPGSGSSRKVWPHFAALAKAIPDAVVLTGPCETGFAFSGPRLEGLALHEVIDELRHCRRFVGCDSGITHLAAYLGCPALALFGPTDPRVWGPVGRRVEILWKTPLADISVEEVIQRI
ncbi:MAG TPA: glycosyltransferase family 9 protein [Terriglobia bacterium]|nr:glycosyltransferase family 9 protein [Terriglobia bacterium]